MRKEFRSSFQINQSRLKKYMRWGFALLLISFCQLHGKRERISFDDNWKFALGHATDSSHDFGHGKGYFSYLAKTGFGDGPASPHFDDRSWRVLDVPHDWAVEMPFDPKASASHGFKAVGPGFPEHSVGWYRKSFFVPEQDLGRHIFVEFDGVFRDADIFINGFFVGNEPSGYLGHAYDLSDYLNYGGDNILVVRVDASFEEGWFYEGAGIYRHVWMSKTEPLHWVKDGLWVNPVDKGDYAEIQVQAEISNKADREADYFIVYEIFDHEDQLLKSQTVDSQSIKAGGMVTDVTVIDLPSPRLWNLDDPYLYTLKAKILNEAGNVLDLIQTNFGVRTVRWDPNHGFFLNGKHVKLKGTNNHQDHAGVGAAIPDSMQVWRLEQLKKMGNNVYRASHNPPTVELLDACDRMGILVIDETRLMGINPYHFTQLERLVRRDRNHPSVILWSLGNEEWAIEGNIKGARITKTMQDYCHRLDPTRYTTVAISGGWGGVSHSVQCAGVNYIGQADPDQQHVDYPEQIILGTEETTTQQTRGIYFRNDERCHLPPLEDGSSKGNAELGWKFYDERDYAAGVIYWTGFDYRGEPTPYGYPAISSQFGILDTCGFPKDGFYYLQSWWTDEPVLHVFPHWNWEGKEGEIIDVRIHSNCETAELFLNGESQGTKKMEKNGHLAWSVPYTSGQLTVKAIWSDGYTREKTITTTGETEGIVLSGHRSEIPAQKGEVVVVKVSAIDGAGLVVPDAEELVEFELEGPGRIIGVGNGNPSSHESDVYIGKVWSENLGFWTPPNPADAETKVVFECEFDQPNSDSDTQITLLLNELGDHQRVILNGDELELRGTNNQLDLSRHPLKTTGNKLNITATPYQSWNKREGLFQFHPAVLKFTAPAEKWKRKLFNGYAQVIVESTGEPGVIRLKAKSGKTSAPELLIVAE